jgi:hypothetical protein
MVLGIALVLSSSPQALAETQRCEIACRATAWLRTCKVAMDGKKLLTMRVTDVRPGSECSQIVKLKPENASANNLHDDIEMEFGPCVWLAAKVGDTIQMAVRDELNKITGRYVSACNPWR